MDVILKWILKFHLLQSYLIGSFISPSVVRTFGSVSGKSAHSLIDKINLPIIIKVKIVRNSCMKDYYTEAISVLPISCDSNNSHVTIIKFKIVRNERFLH